MLGKNMSLIKTEVAQPLEFADHANLYTSFKRGNKEDKESAGYALIGGEENRFYSRSMILKTKDFMIWIEQALDRCVLNLLGVT
jgi:hypothetical protein